ncbi:probable cytochrome P450 9f2 [Stomoxys calcitrans]|uniref:probable cytochrome P450 9f2 n=1 Tax=Stomoxys calcitrans TaxID=35570 RepID=UPI0027E36C23|nr:probable cytochrome P450 9f2 [Stomoxys calcitrans]
MWFEILILPAVFVLVVFYRWGTKNHDFFKKRNIPYEKPAFIFGGGAEIVFRKKSVVQVQQEIHNRHNGIAYGAFDNRDPILMLKDPQLIKQIMIKDFDHFVNRRPFFEDTENLFGSSIFLMENEKWRDMRSTLSPAFTGSKMRQMFQLVLQILDEAMKHLEEHSKAATNTAEGFELDVKDFTIRLMNGVIASTAFGLETNSFKDEGNEFYEKAKKAVNFTPGQQIKAIFITLLPKVAKIFRMEIFDKEFSQYFKQLVMDTMKYRQEKKIRRADMIDLLMGAKGMIPSDIPKTKQHNWSDVEIVAQCFIFFFAALEPLSTTMSFAVRELLEYPDVQEKLYEEIKSCNEQLQGKQVTYELLQKMPYMEMVVSEVLRKWPVGLVVDRTCTQDFSYESPETGERIEIRKGDFVRASMIAIHRDAKNFENPDVLDPERFSEENKSQIDPGLYLPFGLGPRNCIGNRFALLVFKAFLYNLVLNYSLQPSSQTVLPTVMDKKTFQLRPVGGFWTLLKSRA